jgi:hypothetical protein
MPRGVNGQIPAARSAGRFQPPRRPAPTATFRALEGNPISSWALALYVFLFGSLTVEFIMIHSGVRFSLVGPVFILMFLVYLVSGHLFRFAEGSSSFIPAQGG